MSEWTELSKTEAVLRLLADGPLTAKEATHALEVLGRNDQNVNQCLSSLGKQGKVVSLGDKKWGLPGTTAGATNEPKAKTTTKKDTVTERKTYNKPKGGTKGVDFCKVCYAPYADLEDTPDGVVCQNCGQNQSADIKPPAPGTRAAKKASQAEADAKLLSAVTGNGTKATEPHICGWCLGAPRTKTPEGSHKRCNGNNCLCADHNHQPTPEIRKRQAGYVQATIEQVTAADPGLQVAS